jgi:hypothetical protein
MAGTSPAMTSFGLLFGDNHSHSSDGTFQSVVDMPPSTLSAAPVM